MRRDKVEQYYVQQVPRARNLERPAILAIARLCQIWNERTLASISLKIVAGIVIPIRLVTIALSVAVAVISDACTPHQSARAPSRRYSFKRMADHKQWLTENVNVNTRSSGSTIS
jgi:hypothetical protein